MINKKWEDGELAMEVIRKKDAPGEKVVFAGEKIFWQRDLQRVFEKEGWSCFRLENADRESAEIIRVHNIPVLLYTVKERLADEPPGRVLQDLLTVLQLGTEYGVQRFYLLTPVSAVKKSGQQTISPLAELAERITAAWADSAPCSLCVLRLPEVYGPDANPDETLVTEWLSALLTGESVAELPEMQARDFIYVDDAVYGIYRAVSREYEGTPLNLVTGRGITGREFTQCIQAAAGSLPRIDREHRRTDYDRPVLSAQQAKKELGWQLKYSWDEGVLQTWKAVKTAASHQTAQFPAEPKKMCWQRAVPYAENAAGFLLMLLIAWLQDGTPVNPVIRFDMNYIYIGAMGMLYGKRQSLLSMLLASCLLIYTMIHQGGNLIGLLYIPEVLLHVVSYLFTAVLTGYFSDNRAQERKAARWQISRAGDRYDFLHSLYEENMEVKDRLYRQIVNSDDSIGRLYRIIRNLDSVEPENIFTQAAVVTAKVLNVDDIAVYVVGSDQRYLRQKVRIGKLASRQPRSLRVEDHPYLQTLLREKTIYANRELVKDEPDLAAPIVYQDKVIAVVEIFGMQFEQWSLYQQNLLSITVRLVSSSMGRAYQYEREIQERKYFAGTRILQESEFQKLLEELRSRREVQGDLPIAVLRVNMPDIDYTRLDEQLSKVIRNEDFVGVLEDGVYILLPDADVKVTAMVQKRLEQKGLETIATEGIL